MALTSMGELGFKVKMKITQQGINQNELAEKIGCTPAVLSSVINGGSNLRLEEVLEYYIKTGKVYKYDYDKDR